MTGGREPLRKGNGAGAERSSVFSALTSRLISPLRRKGSAERSVLLLATGRLAEEVEVANKLGPGEEVGAGSSSLHKLGRIGSCPSPIRMGFLFLCDWATGYGNDV